MTANDFMLGRQYSRREAGSIKGYEKIAGSQSGLVYLDGTTALMVTLEKKDRTAHYQHRDYFDGDLFHWIVRTNNTNTHQKY
jgi:hypothetical protein